MFYERATKLERQYADRQHVKGFFSAERASEFWSEAGAILAEAAKLYLFVNEARFFRFRVFFPACYIQNEVGDPLIFLHF